MCMNAYPLELFIGQADAVLHPYFVIHATFFAQNGDSLDSDPVLDNAGSVLLNRNRRALDTSPRANAAVPADNRI